jgi:hypothetical protein
MTLSLLRSSQRFTPRLPLKPALHAAYDDAERIRERLPSRLQELWEAMGLSIAHPGS